MRGFRDVPAPPRSAPVWWGAFAEVVAHRAFAPRRKEGPAGAAGGGSGLQGTAMFVMVAIRLRRQPAHGGRPRRRGPGESVGPPALAPNLPGPTGRSASPSGTARDQ